MKISRNTKWRVLWTATAMNLFGGLLYIWSVISNALVTQYHWTSTQASLPYTIATVSFVIAMAAFGKVFNAKGPRFCGTIAGICIGAGVLLSGLTQNPAVMVLTFGIIAGSGVGIITLSTSTPAIQWFPPEKKGMATGIVMGSIALASILYSPLVHFLADTVGISNTFICIGAGAGIMIVLLAQFLKSPPAGYTAQTNSKPELHKNNASVSDDIVGKKLLRQPSFYMIWLMLAFSATPGLMIIGHAANITTVQANWDGGFILVIFLAVFNTLGRVLGGIISDKIGRINLFRFIFTLQAVNMIFFSFYNSIPLLFIGVAITGFCYGASFAVFPAITADLYGVKNYASNYGIVFTAWGIGGVIGPMIAASIFDATKSYYSAYIIACIFVSIAAVIAFAFKNSRLKGD